MRRNSSVSLGLGAAMALMLTAVAAPVAFALPQDPQQQPVAPAAAPPQVVQFSADQLDNLVAPVALYPDPLLAQVLLAATFPDQIAEAAQYVRANGTNGIDDQYWDVSVKAVAHYPTILNMMDTRIDWTTSLGQAYAQQSTDVMQSVQHMRDLAQAQGNLESTPQQQVVADNGYIRIWPAQPQYIYVPVYDPSVIYCRPVFGRPGFGAYFSFGVGYPIGAWLMYDWDWPAWRIVYTGWYGGGWIARSRPYVRFTNVYVNAGYRHVRYGRDVIYRHPNYAHIHVYNGLGPHRVDYTNHMDHNAGRYAVPRGGAGHGTMTPGGGYHPDRRSTVNAHVRVVPPTTAGVRRTSTNQPSTIRPRTATPRTATGREAPALDWRNQRAARSAPPARVEPRYVAPPERRAEPRYVAPPRAEPRYTAPSRVQPRVSAPRYSAPARVEPRYTAPRSAPQVHVRSAPPRESSHASAPRSAHHRGGHGE